MIINSDEYAIGLKNDIQNHLDNYFKELENKKDQKSVYRSLYNERVLEFRENLKKSISQEKFSRLLNFFATGSQIDHYKIDPELVWVNSDEPNEDASNLFKLATSFWSVPPSPGYGRRLRFLVMDKNNGKLIGVFALGEAVIGQKIRDEWIGWDHKQRFEKISSIDN